MASPLCEIKNGGAAYVASTNGVDVTPAATVIIRLASSTGVTTWSISCVYTDETSDASTVTSGLTIDTVLKTATFTAPAAGKAYIFQSRVNAGLDANGAVDPTLTTTFGIYTLTASSLRVIAAGETTEGSTTFGWAASVNDSIRNAGGSSNATQLQGENISATPPTGGNLLVYSGVAWVPGAVPNSGVSAGSYTSADITVGADGRITAAANGSGGGGARVLKSNTVPAAATWTIKNAGDGFSVTDDPDGDGVIFKRNGATKADENISAVQTIAAGTKWNVVAGGTVFAQARGGGYVVAGLYVSDGTKSIDVSYVDSAGTLSVYRNSYINDTTSSSNASSSVQASVQYLTGSAIYFVARCDGTTLELGLARDPKDSDTVAVFHSAAKGAFLGTITQVGIVLRNGSGGTSPARVRLAYWTNETVP